MYVCMYVCMWLNISNSARYHAYPSPWQVFMQAWFEPELM